LKIAIYSGNIPSTTFIENLIDGLAKAGFEILLFGKQTKKVSYTGNVKIYPTPVPGIKLILFVGKEFLKLMFLHPGLFSICFKKIRRKSKGLRTFFKDAGVILPILNSSPEIFHIQWAKMIERYPEIFELLNSRFALSLRGAHINYSPLIDENLANAYRKNFEKIDSFHAVSNAIGREAMKYGADERKIKVIHSSVKVELLGKQSIEFDSKQTLEIISIGRFHWKKGYHYALDAVKYLKENKVNFKYTIIAQGEIPEEILFMIDEYGIEDKVSIIQGLPHNELIEKLTKSHLLLLPSVEEGIANVVLEAMAVGVPVITTDCGGMNEVIEDKVNGYIIAVRNPELIIQKINEFIESDNNFKSKMTAGARETIVNEFSGEKQVREFSGFYNSLVQ
jgi:glycosyltransferase involved in cell wall biosynthesis